MRIKLTKIRDLPNRPEFCKLPAQAIECQIDMCSYVHDGDWTTHQISIFKRLIMKYGDKCSYGITFKELATPVS